MKRLFNNTLMTLFDYCVLVVLSIIATPILIENFGVDGYGAFVFLSIFSIYGALAVFDLGMEGALMNYTARFEVAGDHQKMQDALAVTIVYYGLIGAVLGVALHFVAGFVASHLLKDGSTVSVDSVLAAINVVSWVVFLQYLSVPLTAALQGMRKYVITKTVNSVMNLIRYTLLIAVAVLTRRIDLAFMIVLAMTVVRILILLYYILARSPQYSGMRLRVDMAVFRTLFSYSSILFVTRIIGLIHNQLPKVLIWYYMAVAVITTYDVVARPSMMLRVVFGVITAAVIPEVAMLHERKDTTAIFSLYKNLIRYAYLIILPLLAVLFAHIDTLLSVWVGEAFESDSYLALILLAVYLVIPAPAIASTMVVGLEQVRQTIWIPIVATVINVVLSIILLQHIGLAGLLIASLCAQAFNVVPYVRFMKRFLGFSYRDIVLPVLPAWGLALGFYFLNLLVRFVGARHHIVLLAIAGCLALVNYGLYYWFLLSSEERAFLWERFGKVAVRLRGASGAN